MASTIHADMVHGLIELGDLDGLQKYTPPRFDWSQPLGPSYMRMPALLCTINDGLSETKAKQAKCLKILEWLLKVGADPEQRALGKICGDTLFIKDEEESTGIRIEYTGQNAMSFAVAWLKQMQLRKGGADWSQNEEYLKKVIWLLSSSTAAKSHAADVTVPQSTLSLWESMRDLTSSHNVIFEGSDGEVTAHDQILMLASPVLKAMLQSAMKEGSSRRIQDLAHRWNVQGVVETLCVALRDLIDANSFVAIAEAAALKGLQTLERACASFGAADKKVQDMLKKGSLPAAVRKLLGEPDETVDPERLPKKRRLFRSS
ncbi:unnamed protein product [Symbiodinium sp. CCMP2592]|nr:unnamed protein product [Symbiodinium sp. CCMP2592]